MSTSGEKVVEAKSNKNLEVDDDDDDDAEQRVRRREAKQKAELPHLIHALSNGTPLLKENAASKLRMMARGKPANRLLLAEAGAIPPLAEVFADDSEGDDCREFCAGALQNLMFCDEDNQVLALRYGVLPTFMEQLHRGSVPMQEIAAGVSPSLRNAREGNGAPCVLGGGATCGPRGALRGNVSQASQL